MWEFYPTFLFGMILTPLWTISIYVYDIECLYFGLGIDVSHCWKCLFVWLSLIITWLVLYKILTKVNFNSQEIPHILLFMKYLQWLSLNLQKMAHVSTVRERYEVSLVNSKPAGVSLDLESSPNEFSWYLIVTYGNNILHATTYLVLEIRWRLRIGDAETSSNF